MMMFLVPPVVLVALIAWLKTRRWFAAAPLITIAIAYGLALATLCAHPYFEDNGSIEWIGWPGRLVLSLELSEWLSTVLLPIVVLVHAGYRRLAAYRSARAKRGPA